MNHTNAKRNMCLFDIAEQLAYSSLAPNDPFDAEDIQRIAQKILRTSYLGEIGIGLHTESAHIKEFENFRQISEGRTSPPVSFFLKLIGFDCRLVRHRSMILSYPAIESFFQLKTRFTNAKISTQEFLIAILGTAEENVRHALVIRKNGSKFVYFDPNKAQKKQSPVKIAGLNGEQVAPNLGGTHESAKFLQCEWKELDSKELDQLNKSKNKEKSDWVETLLVSKRSNENETSQTN